MGKLNLPCITEIRISITVKFHYDHDDVVPQKQIKTIRHILNAKLQR